MRDTCARVWLFRAVVFPFLRPTPKKKLVVVQFDAPSSDKFMLLRREAVAAQKKHNNEAVSRTSQEDGSRTRKVIVDLAISGQRLITGLGFDDSVRSEHRKTLFAHCRLRFRGFKAFLI